MLAEKYRPRDFEQLVGHTQTVRAAKWYLDHPANGGLAFLVTGPSGCGKTTFAGCCADYWNVGQHDRYKIESAECKVDVLREVAGNMWTYGFEGRKMFLVDEVHTISGPAKDRMLSLLEGLPDHVLLVATTTEKNWTDGTLFSRFVRFDLSEPDPAEVAKHIDGIARAEGLPIPSDPAWASQLVSQANGNVRDAINQLPNRLLTWVPMAA